MDDPKKLAEIEVGPFEHEPTQLGSHLSERFSGQVDGDTIRERCESWLVLELEAAGVTLGVADREIVAVIVDEGWSVAQIVRGWVVRACDAASC